MKSNLGETIGEWKQQWRAEGEAGGFAKALISLLMKRFGAVAPSWRKQIGNAKLDTLELWFERALVAPDLRSVFRPSARRTHTN